MCLSRPCNSPGGAGINGLKKGCLGYLTYPGSALENVSWLSSSPQRRRGKRHLLASAAVSAGSWCESVSLCPAARGTPAGLQETGPS